MKNSIERTAVFIDGSNLYASTKALNLNIDYSKMLKWLAEDTRLVRAYYYTAIGTDEDGFSPVRKLADWLDYNGFSLVTKDTKQFTDQVTGRTKIKGNMDIEIAVDAMEMSDHVDHVILFSGDGDFRKLVEAIQRKGVRVTVISTIKSDPPMVADELRRQADEFIDLSNLAPSICKA